MHYLGLCAIARDETPYLREWVEFHAMSGVEHLIIYDNESAEPVAQTLADHVKAHLVTVVEIGGACPQQQAYRHCLETFGNQFRWLGFIDLDEFLQVMDGDDLRIFLRDYEEYAALAICWRQFGSSGNDARPVGYLMESNHCLSPLNDPANRHVKCMVQPRHTASPSASPHMFIYKENMRAVDELGLTVHGNEAPHTEQKIRLNHYAYRSREDWNVKVARWGNNHDPASAEELEAVFERQLLEYIAEDRSMEARSRQLREFSALGADRINDQAKRFCGHRPMHEFWALASAALPENPDEALVWCRHAAMHHGPSRDVFMLEAMISAAVGDEERAERLAAKALEEGTHFPAWILLARLALDRGERGDRERAEAIISHCRTVMRLLENENYSINLGERQDLDIIEARLGNMCR